MEHLRSLLGSVVVLSAALTLSACAGDEADSAHSLSAALPHSTGGVTPLGDADVASKTHRPEAPSQLVVTDVRLGTHDGFDRVVFDLEGEGKPGWFVDYTVAPARQGSVYPIEVEGNEFLSVNIDGIVFPDDIGIDDPQLTTTPGVGNITEVVNTGVFEGRNRFIVGLDNESPYSVQILEDPLRIVIDIIYH
ncbi:hypothetical protein QP027_01890 [Corynebacterium breve]|uniref:AMIN-like domain-containing protein n=1 Tax=Corynebacterium breve TaxID=3049799 RepID=A0ABY8VEV1_9CORY|nr:hypothetical protein [Corynebacterium breve]WIM68175.1 hypothetical protein QP027_01890 [Corynebacterium breve]